MRQIKSIIKEKASSALQVARVQQVCLFFFEIIDASKWPESQRGSIIHTEAMTDSLDDCPFTGLSVTQNKYVKVLQALETDWGCAGVCFDPKFFLFSNVNR